MRLTISSLLLVIWVQKVISGQVPATQEPIASPLDLKDIQENDAWKSNEEVLKESLPASTRSPKRSSPLQCPEENTPDLASLLRCSLEHQSQRESNSGKCYLNCLKLFWNGSSISGNQFSILSLGVLLFSKVAGDGTSIEDKHEGPTTIG